jgi:hypothetical protein
VVSNVLHGGEPNKEFLTTRELADKFLKTAQVLGVLLEVYC